MRRDHVLGHRCTRITRIRIAADCQSPHGRAALRAAWVVGPRQETVSGPTRPASVIRGIGVHPWRVRHPCHPRPSAATNVIRAIRVRGKYVIRRVISTMPYRAIALMRSAPS
jgi:hypothetical protein